MLSVPSTHPIVLSIGMMAWNEEKSIVTTLRSLFEQTVFEKLSGRGQRCEIVVIANGCTDRTVQVASDFFAQMQREHPCRDAFAARVEDVAQPGRNNAWNRFVHEFSSREASFITMMDADIVFRDRDTLFSLFHTMEQRPNVDATSSLQCKDLMFKERKSVWDRLSLATSRMTGTIEGQITGQLYCMRGRVARNIYLPRDFGATDDGYFKQAICTDFFSRPLDASRIQRAPNAVHIYEAYVKPRDILNNQKRQMIGQTILHVMIEHVKTWPAEDRQKLAETLRNLETRDPDWLRKLIRDHLSTHRFFWQLFPGILTFRFRRCFKLPGLKKVTHLPAACAGWAVTMIACYRAHRALSAGAMAYWPKATRETILAMPQVDVNK